jgi:hypothetical protein
MRAEVIAMSESVFVSAEPFRKVEPLKITDLTDDPVGSIPAGDARVMVAMVLLDTNVDTD